MKKHLLFFAFFVLIVFGHVGLGQLTQFDFPATNSLVVSSKNANVTVSDISLSTGTIETNIITGTYFPNEPYIEETAGWTATTQATAKCFTFTITANSGYQFSITNISFNAYATSTGPSAFSAEIDGTSLTAVNAPDAAILAYSQSISKTGLTSALVKIQGWLNGSRTTAGSGVFRLDDVIIIGSITAVPEINLKQNSTNYLTGSTYNFGNFAVGSSSNSVVFTIENLGNSDLTISGSPKIVTSGTNSSEFTVNESSTSATVSSSGSTTFGVIFSPVSKGTKTATLTINNNDADESAYTINLSATGNLGTNVVIAEIYGGGGNSGASYTNDYIVLYNPTASSVDLSTWSVQYASAASTFSALTNLAGSISASGYYLIKEASGGAVGAALPTPDVTGTIIMSGTAGKVALVGSQVLISSKADGSVIDFIGYGSTANEYETAYMTGSGLSDNSSSLRRKDNSGSNTYGSNGSGWDTDNNSSDFYRETDISINAPLPVELTSFSASVNAHTRATLSWKTATEVNNYGFDIERTVAFDDKVSMVSVWSKVGFVNGAGNSNSPKEYNFTDKSAASGKYLYRLKQLDNDGQYTYSKEVEVDLGTPTAFALEQNYPNPFNPTTSMQYSVSNLPNGTVGKQFVTIKVFDMLGREVALLVNGEKEPGTYTTEFATTGLASGTYIYRMQAGEFVQTRKMIVLK